MTANDRDNLHVLLISNRFAAPGGGTEILTSDLASALLNRGHQVTRLATGAAQEVRSRERLRLVPVEVSVDSSYPANWRHQEEQIAALTARTLAPLSPIDVVHVTHFSQLGLGLLGTPPLSAVPTVATLTDYTTICPDYQLWVRRTGAQCTPDAPAKSCLDCLGLGSDATADVESWRRRNLDWLNNRVRRFWVQTPHQARRLAAAGVDTRHLVSDQAVYDVPAEWVLEPQPSPEPSDYLLFAGRCSPEKGLHVLLDAYAARCGGPRLVVVAAPDDEQYERRLRERTENDPRVQWRPAVAREALASLLRGARALMIPSQWHENHPMIANEALALGTPVFCSDVPSMRHLRGTTGLHLVDRYRDPDGWAAAVTAAEQVAVRPCPDVRERRERFGAFVDEVVAVYRREVLS